jgi:hypothetical protein
MAKKVGTKKDFARKRELILTMLTGDGANGQVSAQAALFLAIRRTITSTLLVARVDPDLTESPEPDTLYLTPREQYDGALMGYTRTPMDYWERTSNCVVAVYCRNCVEKAVGNLLGTKDKLEIAEFCDFNIAGAWVGEYTPEIRDGDWHRCV